jgi:hypothetical protein
LQTPEVRHRKMHKKHTAESAERYLAHIRHTKQNHSELVFLDLIWQTSCLVLELTSLVDDRHSTSYWGCCFPHLLSRGSIALVMERMISFADNVVPKIEQPLLLNQTAFERTMNQSHH